MKRNSMVFLTSAFMICASVFARDVVKPAALQVTVELKDGSILVGRPVETSLPVKLNFAEAKIPFGQIQQCEVQHDEGRITLNLVNGDKVTGTPEARQFKIETSLGTLSPEFAQIERVTFSTGEKPLAEKGSISFDGLNWLAWKTLFEVKGDKLVTLPEVRPGFNYGHNGSGRGPTLMSNIGNPAWKDYRLDFEYCVTGVDPSFNSYGLPADYHDGVICFHVADAKENWNQRGASMYSLYVQGSGVWTLKCVYNDYCRVPVGFGDPGNDGERTLASGTGLKIDRKHGNKYRIEVKGEDIKIWIDGQQIVNVTDELMDQAIAGQTLDHGGVGFHWGLDTMGWIRNFSYKPL